jgi:hypothetical protein
VLTDPPAIHPYEEYITYLEGHIEKLKHELVEALGMFGSQPPFATPHLWLPHRIVVTVWFTPVAAFCV